MEQQIGLALMQMLERIAQGFTIALALAIIEERALSVLFNWKHWQDRFDGRGLKVPIALVFALVICWMGRFDLVAMVIPGLKPNPIGILMTAMLVSGGSGMVIAVAQALKKGSKQLA